MDSDDSRQSSTSSNLSSNFSKLSRASSPATNDWANEGAKDSSGTPIASPISSPDNRYRRADSNLSNRFQSNSESSDSADSSSDIDNDDGDVSFQQNEKSPRKSPTLPGSDIDSMKERNVSVSPDIKSPRSSGGYQSSTNRSRSNSLEHFENCNKVNISHEDLSDVSDLDSEKRDSKQSIDDNVHICSNNEDNSTFAANVADSKIAPITDLRQKLDEKKNQAKNIDEFIECSKNTVNGNAQVGDALVDLIKTHDEDALDFEAEEGECQDVNKDEVNKEFGSKNIDEKNENSETTNSKLENEEELEEGEVSDEDEKRPEETEPKPVCRFYTRGQCTWGMSCRFLHPGVTDKGNYTMFDLVRPVPLPPGGNAVPPRSSGFPIHPVDFHDYRAERPNLLHRNPGLHHAAAAASAFVGHHDVRPVNVDAPVVVESAWERGLRTAKEMMRKANKRKEQDMDFEDKKMNLTLSPDELEKEPYYLKDRMSPSENMRHMVYQESSGAIYSPPDRYGRGPPMPHYDEVDPYGRSTRYRELPPHRMPQYEDERRIRPTREVIVQRVEPVGRSDEWNDPWMRSKSPGGRDSSRDHIDKRRRDRRSYSSNSSYSSSSTSQSDSSSDDSSHTLSPADHHRRHYNSSSHKSPVLRRHSGRSIRSPDSQPRRLRRSSSGHRSPVSKRKLNVSPTAIYNKGGPYTPMHKRKRDTSISKKLLSEKLKSKRHRSSSSSDSVTSGSSGSTSESDSASSTSESTSRSKDRLPPRRSRAIEKTANERKDARKGESFKKRSPISIEIKKPAAMGVSALSSLSPTHPSLVEKDTKKSRREELLKQLRAVEDAIAKKRSKLV